GNGPSAWKGMTERRSPRSSTRPSALRIIAGSRKGARIFAPKGLEVRPTGDRVREAMFSLIGPVDGAHVLDLFAGTGALGLEALSRGAASAVFVDSDRVAAETVSATWRSSASRAHACTARTWVA